MSRSSGPSINFTGGAFGSANPDADTGFPGLALGNDFGVDQTNGFNKGSQLTISDLLSNSSLDEAIHKNRVTRLAQGLASLDAGSFVGVTQTLMGIKSFEQDDWLTGATQAKALGAQLAIIDETDRSLVMFGDDGDAYIFGQPSSGSSQWFKVGLGKIQQIVLVGVENQKEIKAQAALMEGIASAADKHVPGFNGFFTTKQPFTSLPTVGMMGDGSMSFTPGKKFVGVSASLPGFNFKLVSSNAHLE